jgi:hypothetical protein
MLLQEAVVSAWSAGGKDRIAGTELQGETLVKCRSPPSLALAKLGKLLLRWRDHEFF